MNAGDKQSLYGATKRVALNPINPQHIGLGVMLGPCNIDAFECSVLCESTRCSNAETPISLK